MKVKTSVSLSEDLLREIDERIAAPGRRSDFIESAVREHLARVARDENDAHDREIYNRLSNDAEHQAELEDVLRLQADLNGPFEGRGELYRVRNPGGGDPRRTRVVLVVSRNALVESTYRSITCVPVFSGYHGLPTQVPVGDESGLKHDSALHCDNVVSIPRSSLTDYVGSLSPARMSDVNRALTVALALDVPV